MLIQTYPILFQLNSQQKQAIKNPNKYPPVGPNKIAKPLP